MKFRVPFVVAALFCQALFAKTPVPLGKSPSGDRTNHPVLFVSGLGSNASGTWGAKGSQKEVHCEDAEPIDDISPIVSDFSWKDLKIPHINLRLGKLLPRIKYPYRCSNMAEPFYGGEVALDAMYIWHKGKVGKEDIRFGFIDTLPDGKNLNGWWLIPGEFNRVQPEVSFSTIMDYIRGKADTAAVAKQLYCQVDAFDIIQHGFDWEQFVICNGWYVSIDSLRERSSLIVAKPMDYPTSYKERGLAHAFAEAFDIPHMNMDENFSKITNGLYFFNPKSRCRASSDDNIGADCDSLDDWANPRWDTTFENYGQPNQLLDKMVRSLDDFYGKGAWHDDTNAVIDIVAHSQGGLTTRIAIDKSRSQNGSNPVNHINRIVTIDSPHRGSALATSSEWLKNGNPDDNNAKYPQLAGLKDWLFSKDSFLSLKGSLDLVPVNWLQVTQSLIDALLPSFIASLAHTSATAHINLNGAPLGPYNFEFELDLNLALFFALEIEHEDETFTLGDIGDLALKSEHLAWPFESTFMRELREMPYPTYPSNSTNIHVTHFHSNGLSQHFLETFGLHVLPWAKKQCEEKIRRSEYSFLVDTDSTCRKLLTKIRSGRFGDSWNTLQERFKQLDTDWPYRSDLVVENSSQKGINSKTGYSEDDTPEFRAKVFRWNPSTVIHGALPEGISDIVKDMGLAAATQQKCDILSELGAPISSFEGECDYPTSLDHPAYVNIDGKNIRIIFKSAAKTAKSSISSFDYYFVAEPGKALDVQTSGADASVKVEHVGGAIHKATIRPAAPAEGDWPANGEFSLSIQYADGTPRDASNDPSMPVSDGIALSIPVFDETGRRVGGLVPQLDTLDQNVASLYTISVEAMERSGANTITQPSVRIRNEGDLALHGFKMRYTVTSVRKPELRVYWIDRMPNATWKLVELGDHRWAAEFDYAGLDLKKGESVSPIDFELFNPDWSPWNRDDDHSALGVGNEWAVAPFVEVFLPDGGRLWGLSPEMIERDTTEAEAPRTSLKVVGREESDLYNKSTHRLRVVNDGDVPVEGFVVYDYFTSGGQEPLFDAWDVPRCAVSKEHLGGLEWRLVYDCSNVVLDPGQEADWAEWGMLVDRHYPDWSAWDASNDWSALTSEWAEATRVRVVAKDGTPLWGEAPALAAPAPASFAMGLPGPLGPEFLPPL